LLLILLAAAGVHAAHAASPPARSLEQLERVSTLLRTLSDRVPGSGPLARRCKLTPKKAGELLRRMHPVWDEKVKERVANEKVADTLRHAQGCEKSCICGAYASVLEGADPIEGVRRIRESAAAQTPEQGLACARQQIRETCAPGLLRELRRLPR
jgi:hypothetical protein